MNYSALEIDMFPPCMKDFSQPSACEDQKPDRRDRKWVQLPKPLFGLCDVLCIWMGFIDRPRQTACLRPSKGIPEPS
jgi:hypothetical protein